MKKFLAENWLWIVLPAVLAILALLALVVVMGSRDGTAEFIYHVDSGLIDPACHVL